MLRDPRPALVGAVGPRRTLVSSRGRRGRRRPRPTLAGGRCEPHVAGAVTWAPAPASSCGASTLSPGARRATCLGAIARSEVGAPSRAAAVRSSSSSAWRAATRRPFLFASARALDHPPATIHAHDPGAFITMGPGAGVELCLWSAGPRAVTSEAVPLSGWEPASLLPVRSSHRRRGGAADVISSASLFIELCGLARSQTWGRTAAHFRA